MTIKDIAERASRYGLVCQKYTSHTPFYGIPILINLFFFFPSRAP